VFNSTVLIITAVYLIVNFSIYVCRLEGIVQKSSTLQEGSEADF